VAILANGSVQPLQTVSAGGTIAVPAGTTKAQAGLAFTARLTWLRPEVRDASGGTIQGKTKRLVNLFLRVLETAGVKIDAGAGKVDELIGGRVATPMNEAAAAVHRRYVRRSAAAGTRTARRRSFPTSRSLAWSLPPCRGFELSER
jgi:hypothetical protein